MSRIFVSYRRADRPGHVGRVHDRLQSAFGDDAVFMDVESIPYGERFAETIDEALETVDVVIVAMGPDWATGSEGTKSLHDPDDWIRIETIKALDRHDLRVVPILLDGAPFPNADELPEEMRGLLERNIVEIRDTKFDSDVADLIRSLSDRVPLRRRRLIAAGAALALVLVVAGFFVFGGDDTPGPEPMTGDFNIAVADFDVTEGDAAEGTALATSLSDQLDEAMRSADTSFDVAVAGPARTGSVSGADRAARATNAAQLAEELNADLIIYGTLDPGDPSSFTPEFFLRGDKLTNAEELAGDYQLGTPLEQRGNVLTNPAARTELREKLLGRTSAFSDFVLALGWYGIERYDEAEAWMRMAEAGAGWADEDGKEVLYHFLGNVSLRQRDFDQAVVEYERALDLNPEFARSHVGLAEVTLQRALGGVCPSDRTDMAGLEEARAGFLAAGDAAFQPAVSDIPLKVDLGLGRIDRCLGDLGVAGAHDSAAQTLGAVIAAYEEADGVVQRRRQEFAAIAQGELALVIMRRDSNVSLDSRLSQAIDLTTMAIELSSATLNRAFLTQQLAGLLEQAGRDDEAAAARAAVERLVGTLPDPTPTPTSDGAKDPGEEALAPDEPAPDEAVEATSTPVEEPDVDSDADPARDTPTPIPTATSAPRSEVPPTATPVEPLIPVPEPAPPVEPVDPPERVLPTPTHTPTPTVTPTPTATVGPMTPTPIEPFPPDATAPPTPLPLPSPEVDDCGSIGRPTIEGTSGPDVILGTDGVDIIHGRGGDDVIIGLGAGDWICGGDGDDVIFGDDGADVLWGGAGDDDLIGGPGEDTLFGRLGDDRLWGRRDADTLHGGDGRDYCDGGGGRNTAAKCEDLVDIP